MALVEVDMDHLRVGSHVMADLERVIARDNEDPLGGFRTLPQPAGQKGLFQFQMSAPEGSGDSLKKYFAVQNRIVKGDIVLEWLSST